MSSTLSLPVQIWYISTLKQSIKSRGRKWYLQTVPVSVWRLIFMYLFSNQVPTESKFKEAQETSTPLFYVLTLGVKSVPCGKLTCKREARCLLFTYYDTFRTLYCVKRYIQCIAHHNTPSRYEMLSCTVQREVRATELSGNNILIPISQIMRKYNIRELNKILLSEHISLRP